MEISQRGIDFIKKEEGKRLQAYLCPANVWTIGYGHTIGVNKDDVITDELAEQFLREDLKNFEAAINKYVKVSLQQNQYDALVSFCFNVGVGNFAQSTLLKKVNAGAPNDEIVFEFKRWKYAKGMVLPGLVKRREREANLYIEKGA